MFAISEIINRRKPWREAAVMAMLLLGGNAGAIEVRQAVANSEEMLFADDPKNWARPKVVVTPTFPEDQLKLNASGKVDVEVVVDAQGTVKSYRIAKSEPANPAFEKAVEEVAKLWLFYVMLDKECVPMESTGNARVWFEAQDGKGKVSVSGQVSQTAASGNARKPNMLNRKEAAAGIRYPSEMLRAGVHAMVNAVIRVDGKSGEPLDVGIAWTRTSPDPVRDNIVSSLHAEVKRGMMRAKFAPSEGGNYRVCIPFEFKASRI
ncbi:MAG: TonB family protein [Betaproteobacteria bacterium]|nr:TonB family protein [Betaproteobacteria bacterium]